MTDDNNLLKRGVANIIPNLESLSLLISSMKKLNIYFGIDPTATKIHIGHAVPLRKLQQFVELGHNVTFLIGDFTALIGDTSDKDTERPVLTYDQIKANFETYKDQASKIIDFTKVKVLHNSEWLKNLNFEEIVKLCQHFSAGDFINRELMKKRLSSGDHVGLHEVLYPVMQGYDSYHLDTDLQIGGTDQTYNMQAGRILQKDLRNKESFVLTVPFLLGTDGRKMSKSWGNAIWIEDSPNDMFGKVMSIKDELILDYFTLATDIPLTDIPNLTNPMEAKKILAHTIVSEIYGKNEADLAQKYFENTFQNKQIPTDIPTVTLTEPTRLITFLTQQNMTTSGTVTRQLIDEGAIKIDDITVTDKQLVLNPGDLHTIKIGKLKYIKVQ